MSITSDHVPPAPPAREAREGREGRAAAGRGHRAAYAVVGAVMAAVWALGGDTPAWEHALRLLLLILGVSVAVRLVRRRLARTGRVPVSGRLFFGLLAAKMLLVAVALLVDRIAGRWFSDPNLVTAAFLFAFVVACGPALHARLSRGSAPSDAASQAVYTTMKSPQG
ncbi:hypothetical protein ACWGF3_00510 [Streptomyces xanthophaeus]|uniref:hypothetical protein n=1 Tax=Streptomyces xanthophaeus TaxID=67385 RepID=UPI0004CDC07C|nr:hypothetical protein [Streptomyces xanthophaeus]